MECAATLAAFGTMHGSIGAKSAKPSCGVASPYDWAVVATAVASDGSQAVSQAETEQGPSTRT